MTNGFGLDPRLRTLICNDIMAAAVWQLARRAYWSDEKFLTELVLALAIQNEERLKLLIEHKLRDPGLVAYPVP